MRTMQSQFSNCSVLQQEQANRLCSWQVLVCIRQVRQAVAAGDSSNHQKIFLKLTRLMLTDCQFLILLHAYHWPMIWEKVAVTYSYRQLHYLIHVLTGQLHVVALIIWAGAYTRETHGYVSRTMAVLT